ncbi:MAG: helix-turn-helix domain-containing protein [Candidatus Spyradocola sp.]
MIWIPSKRIRRTQLIGSEKKIYEIALETGFENPGYFSYCFKQRCGMTPKNFRQAAEG